jgi:hypothetical protein
MIWTIKVTLLGGRFATSEWVRVFEIDSATGQESLHYLIQRTIGFDSDHLYDFFVARTPRSRRLGCFDDEDDAFCDKTLAELFPLPKDRKLFYYTAALSPQAPASTSGGAGRGCPRCCRHRAQLRASQDLAAGAVPPKRKKPHAY